MGEPVNAIAYYNWSQRVALDNWTRETIKLLTPQTAENPGGKMKEETLATHAESVKQADEALYDAAFAAGKEEGKSESGNFTQADVDAAKKAGFDEAVASDTTPFSKEEMDAVHAELDKAVEAGKLNAELVEKAKALFGAPVPAPVEAAPVDQGTVGTNAEA